MAKIEFDNPEKYFTHKILKRPLECCHSEQHSEGCIKTYYLESGRGLQKNAGKRIETEDRHHKKTAWLSF